MTALPTIEGARLRLGTNDAIIIDGISYRVTGQSPDGYVLQNSQTGLFEAFDHPQFVFRRATLTP